MTKSEIEAVLKVRDEISAKLDKIAKRTGALGGKFKDVGRSFEQVGSKMKAVGSALMPLSLGMAAAGVASMKFAMDLNKGMAEVATLIPGNTERVKELKVGIQDLAVAHGKSTKDLVGGLYQTISAFGDTADTAKILEINSKAATAGVASTLEAISLTSAVTKGYGDTSAAAVEKVSDLAFMAVKLGQTTFPELAASIGRVTPLAAALNVTQEELFATMATLTGVTGNAAEVSTQLAAIQRAMIKPSEGMADAQEKLGFSSAKAMIAELGLVGALDALIATTDGSEEAVIGLLGRAEALSAVLALTGPQAEAFKEKLAAMGVAAGATKEAFDEQTKGINAAGFAWSQFKSEMATVMQDIGDELLPMLLNDVTPALKDMVAEVEEAVKWFSALSPEMKKTAAAGVAVGAAVGPAAIVMGQLTLAAGGLCKFLATAAGTIAIWVAAIGLAVKGLWDIAVSGKEAWSMMGRLITSLREGTLTMGEMGREVVAWLRDFPILGKYLADYLIEPIYKLGEVLGLVDYTKLEPPEMAEIEDRLKGLTKSADEIVEAFFKAGGEFEKFEKVIPPVTRELEDMNTGFVRAGTIVRATSKDLDFMRLEVQKLGRQTEWTAKAAQGMSQAEDALAQASVIVGKEITNVAIAEEVLRLMRNQSTMETITAT